MHPLMGGFGNLLNAINNYQPVIPPFKGVYRCFPVVMANKPSLENGDKIILPPTALDWLARLRVTYPMQFSITNRETQTQTHCGVMEFSAEEGVCYLPYWMMQNLLLQNGQIVDVHNVSLPKGTFVQLQPHTTAFTQLHNPRVVLERALRNFSCLSTGDTIAIQHGEQTFYLDIVEVRPGRAISIIETDVNVDFAPPKDAPKEEERKVTRSSTPSQSLAASTSSSSLSSIHIPDEKFVFHAGNDETQSKFFQQTTNGQTQIVSNSNAAASSSSSSSTTTTNGKTSSGSDYFSKLGAGHKLTNRRTSSKNTSQPQSSPSASPTVSGYSLSPSPSLTSLSAPSTPTPPAPLAAPATVTGEVREVKGQWEYIYNVDAKGVKKLLRRVPATKTSATTQAATPSTGFKAFGGTGHTLK